MYAMDMEGRTEEEAEEYLQSLYAPLDPEQVAADKAAERWLRGG